jgi:hypothetical protein
LDKIMGRLAGSIILLSGWKRTLVAMLAGAVAVLGQAPYDFPAACFVAFPILVWLLDGSAAAMRPGLGLLKPFLTGYWFGSAISLPASGGLAERFLSKPTPSPGRCPLPCWAYRWFWRSFTGSPALSRGWCGATVSAVFSRWPSASASPNG